MLIMISGLPASGKSYFAKALCKKISAHYLNSDVIREEMKLRGKYDPEVKELVYTEMLVRAGQDLVAGKNVVVDGTFSKAAIRGSFYELAEKMEESFSVIVIKAHEDIIAERMKKKRKYSEADFEVYLKLKDEYEPINRHHIILWSDGLTLDQMLEKAIDYLPINQEV